MPEALVRVTGGLVELLDGVGRTEIGRPFPCPEPLAKRLLDDGSGRFARVGSPEAAPAEAECVARDQAAAEAPKAAKAKAKGGT